jgi:hypothetical protein
MAQEAYTLKELSTKLCFPSSSHSKAKTIICRLARLLPLSTIGVSFRGRRLFSRAHGAVMSSLSRHASSSSPNKRFCGHVLAKQPASAEILVWAQQATVSVEPYTSEYNTDYSGQPKDPLLSNEQARREYRVFQWHNLVEQYSELEPTKVADRFPSIGAIAQHYHQHGVRAEETYLAGLWSGSLVKNLMGWVPTVGRRRFGVEVAPSWSWASISYAVQYH